LSINNFLVYHSCTYLTRQSPLLTKTCAPPPSQLIPLPAEKLNLPIVKALTCDRFIYSAREKQELGQRYGVTVVDMEGIALMNYFDSVTIIRVISDDCDHNLPDLNSAINEQGKLAEIKMAIAFWRQPLAAIKLIKGSLKALKVLEKVSEQIFCSSPP
jgi:nucleoside phosphorylase